MILSNNNPSDAVTADADLVLRSRSGDRAAFGELWRRHYPAGRSVARSITSSIDPDDLVQESYTRIYQAILKGGGPNGSFRAYLFTSIRNTAAAWGRSRRETPIDELDVVIDPSTTDDAADEAIDHDLTAEAFRRLPARWQEVLWYTEVEQMKPAAIAPLLGMKAGAVAQLAFRAREGLREAWILAHLRQAGEDSECQWTLEHLGAHSRGNLSSRDTKRLERHIDECARCVIVAAEAKDVSERLALVLLPLVLGVAGASGYIATLQSTPAVVAAAPIPAGVFESGVGEAAGASPLISTDGGATGDLGGGGNGSTGGAITGIGALVGTGSAALVVAGIVAAAAVVPGLVDASPATSLPSAADLRDSSISSEVEPDPDVEPDKKFLLEIEQDEPETPDDGTPEIKRADRAPLDPPATVSPPAATTPSTSAPSGDGHGDREGAGEVKPTDPPVEPEEPTDPPETPEPEPEPTEPPVDPEEPPIDPEPALPAGTPAWEAATQTCHPGNPLPVTHYTVPLTGAPNATVQIEVVGPVNRSTYTEPLDDTGAGSVILKPTGDQIAGAIVTKVTFRYVLGDLRGEARTTSLHRIYTGKSCLTATVSGDTETPATDEASGPAE